MELFSGLNVQQQQAMSATEGPVLVLAGPGSGKTRVLTQRIAYLIGHLAVRPYNIMAVTFTNKAAREMGERVDSLLGGMARGLSLGTFHSICARTLRREAEHLPFDNNFVIFDDDDQRGLIKRALRDLDLDEKRFRPNSVLGSISRAKNELILADEYPLNTYRDEVVKRIFERYQQLLLASNALDFDDLLLWTARLLQERLDVREKYARRYEHLLVDEFQDTNMAQYTLLRHLSSFHRNIFAVGDVDQSIYRWRGADYRNVQRFEQDFDDTQVVLLEQNYRSTQVILDAAMAVIERNPHRIHKALFTERQGGDKIQVHEAFSGREEAQFIIGTIAEMIALQEADPGDFALMYRTNAQSRLLEEAFLQANLPYKLVGAQRFYGRREVKDMLAYLRLIHNPDDEISLMRIINVPRRKIGNKTYAELRTLALQVGISPGRLVLMIGQEEESPYLAEFSAAAGRALTGFGRLLAAWRGLAAEQPPLAMLDRILRDTDYQTYLDDGTEEGKDRWENVLELRRLATEHEERSMGEFLEEIALVSDQDTLDASAKAPTLLTLHAAKGLEFPIVFITGLEDGTLPHSRSFDDPESMAEERRLLYVGITRAENRLYLTRAANRSTYGYSEPTEPSRFLEDIPDELISGGNPLGYKRMMRQQRKFGQARWDAPRQSAPIIEPSFKAGQNVRHATYGDGMVLSTEIDDGEEIVEVHFAGVGMKRLIASLANLEVI